MISMKNIRILLGIMILMGLFGDVGAAGAASASPLSTSRSGIATYYGRGVMERVRHVRIRQGYHIISVEGMALTGPGSCAHVGELYDIKIGNGNWEVRQVVDCSQPWDAARHARIGLVGEVSYATMSRYRKLFYTGHARVSVRPHKFSDYAP